MIIKLDKRLVKQLIRYLNLAIDYEYSHLGAWDHCQDSWGKSHIQQIKLNIEKIKNLKNNIVKQTQGKLICQTKLSNSKPNKHHKSKY